MTWNRQHRKPPMRAWGDWEAEWRPYWDDDWDWVPTWEDQGDEWDIWDGEDEYDYPMNSLPERCERLTRDYRG